MQSYPAASLPVGRCMRERAASASMPCSRCCTGAATRQLRQALITSPSPLPWPCATGWCPFDDIMLAVRRIRKASGGQVWVTPLLNGS